MKCHAIEDVKNERVKKKDHKCPTERRRFHQIETNLYHNCWKFTLLTKTAVLLAGDVAGSGISPPTYPTPYEICV
ncbi:hypothetical protein NQ318_018531 [Aromia moschata]|uniref:Uncharacterized protein n=1 Tax=Aromia moschata TaxID=1265417 RepID=A0AAV8ZHU2_9CUCU|nr:hypothetical protein NQ318_018531 [Aromia moschata]